MDFNLCDVKIISGIDHTNYDGETIQEGYRDDLTEEIWMKWLNLEREMVREEVMKSFWNFDDLDCNG